MKPFIRLLISLSLLIGHVIAQDLFVEGYILSMNGDTITGWIENQNWKINPQTILYKQSSNAEPTRYAPSDISGFGM